MRRLALVLVLWFALVSACSVADVDLATKECPCVGDYVCDTSINRCVRTLEYDASVVDAADAAPPLPLVVVSGLTFTWATPGVIRWDWKLAGAAADFRAYEIVVGPSADAIDKRVGVDVLTSNERTELGQFDARGGKTRGPVAMWTMTDVRAPATKQFIQISVTDVNGQASRSAIVSGASAPKAGSQLVIFDGKTSKTSVPAADFVFRSPGGGESHYFFRTDCGTAKTCAKRGALVSLGLELAPKGSAFTAAKFDVAFLEIQLEGNVAVSTFDTTMTIEPGAACSQGDNLCGYGFAGWTQRRSGRTSIQVPLRELRNDTGPLTYPTLQGKGFLIDVFALSGTWKHSASVKLYDARIRW